MATTITNKRTQFDFVSENETLKIQGNGTITTLGLVRDVNGSIQKAGAHVGHINYSEDNGNVQRNSYCPADDQVAVYALLDIVVADIKAEFAE